MSPFIPQEDLINIFGKDFLNDNDLQPILKQLKGEADVKPFECVGTIEEVNACLNFSQQTTDNRQQTSTTLTIDDLLNQYDEMNNLPEHFAAILKDNLFKNN